MPYLSIEVLEMRRDAKIKQLKKIGSVLQGTVSTVKTTCGKSNCRCARGEKHISNILTKKVNGKTKSLYIPNDMVDKTKKWVEENKKLRMLQKEISELNEQIIRKYVKTQRAKKENLKIQNRVVNRHQNQ